MFCTDSVSLLCYFEQNQASNEHHVNADATGNSRLWESKTLVAAKMKVYI